MSMTRAGAVVLLALAVLSLRPEAAPLAPDVNATTRSVPVAAVNEARFRLQSSAGVGVCMLAAAGVPELENKRALSFGAKCVELGGGLDAARWWQDREDGSIAFMGDDGTIVAEFAVADGAAFVSYAPREPIMTLLAVD